MSIAVLRQQLQVTPLHLVAMLISMLLGLVAGSSFLWAAPRQAWSIFLAGFLWTLIVSLGAALLRCQREQLRRGEWLRGVVLGCMMIFPQTTLYMLAVALILAGVEANVSVQAYDVFVANKPDWLEVAPIFYAASLVMVLVVGPLYVLTSPFKSLNDIQ